MACCNDKENCSHRELRVEGIPPSIPRGVADLCKARLLEAARELMELTGESELDLNVSNSTPARKPAAEAPRSSGNGPSDDLSVEERAVQYQSRDPFFSFDFLVVPDDLKESLLSAIDLVRLEDQVFGRWNLRSIEPFPRTALNFHGPPGTGKTLAAHALASFVGRPILMASYGQIESKYVGDGAKNVEAVFYAAERDGAILFIDEADSLLSKRLTNVTQGAEQAINSMRSQLLVCLEQFKGVVIFSTNLVENYDRGFETRVRNLYFPMPDEAARREIWRRHLPSELPLQDDVDAARLARLGGICGRDIKSAVIDAALRAARAGQTSIGHQDLAAAVERLKQARIERAASPPAEPVGSFSS